MKAHLLYLSYVLRHKWFVFVECCKLGIPWLGIVHDLSKFRLSEWRPYVLSFYGKWKYSERPAWLVDIFDTAWLHHQRHGKHHWQYFMLIQDEEETKILSMPDKYCREMLADWRGAARAQGLTRESVVDWYAKNKNKMQLHPETRQWIEQQLEVK